MREFFLICLLVFNLIAFEVTPTRVYEKTLVIKKEINLLKEELSLTKEKKYKDVSVDLKPRHVWQRSYMVLMKINILRERLGFPKITVGSMEAVKRIDPILPFEQTLRILAEIDILKLRLGVDKKVSFEKIKSRKNPIDVFNSLAYISYQLDILNTKEITPSYVFSEVMRIYEDVDLILNKLNIEDITYPPKKEKSTPADSFDATFAVIKELQRLQKNAAIERIDFSVFKREDKILPSDVFNMVMMINAETQTIKAYLGIKDLTKPAKEFEDKTPADVHQLLHWIAKRLSIIKNLR